MEFTYVLMDSFFSFLSSLIIIIIIVWIIIGIIIIIWMLRHSHVAWLEQTQQTWNLKPITNTWITQGGAISHTSRNGKFKHIISTICVTIWERYLERILLFLPNKSDLLLGLHLKTRQPQSRRPTHPHHPQRAMRHRLHRNTQCITLTMVVAAQDMLHNNILLTTRIQWHTHTSSLAIHSNMLKTLIHSSPIIKPCNDRCSKVPDVQWCKRCSRNCHNSDKSNRAKYNRRSKINASNKPDCHSKSLSRSVSISNSILQTRTWKSSAQISRSCRNLSMRNNREATFQLRILSNSPMHSHNRTWN
mmetsp:Transcript_1610/g.5521  ORF Transcript_1610/g.5521 Transcript_1610/m.5521 type:complete len:303 (-) Transcript_1610:2460-3368(-)